jgi:ABC-type cobalamin transport system permease subunit
VCVNLSSCQIKTLINICLSSRLTRLTRLTRRHAKGVSLESWDAKRRQSLVASINELVSITRDMASPSSGCDKNSIQIWQTHFWG